MPRSTFLGIGLLSACALLACSTVTAPTGDAPEVSPAVSTTAPEAAAFFSAEWAQDPLWDDGNAEVALYQARRPQYGKIETYEAAFIIVKEDFNPALDVKADPPYEGKTLLPVIKLNALHSYWTDNYPYHFLASVFVRRDAPTRLVKLTLGSQEWCGNTFKEVRTESGRATLTFHSYWDGEGDARRPLDLRPGDLLEDQLPLALRGLKFEKGLEIKQRVVPSLISNNLRAPLALQDATITVSGEEQVATPAGRFAVWRLSLKMGDLEQTWWFEKAAPHRLLKMESSDGRAWLLKAATRKPYWNTATYHPEM